MALILVDMDRPIADFDGGFWREWEKKYPQEFSSLGKDRKSFYIIDDFPEHLKPLVEKVQFTFGFHRNLPPVSGAVNALREMCSKGHDVLICTAPRTRWYNCVSEKYWWVEIHLGHEFTKKIIFAKDKTLIFGDYLIDDKPWPEIGGHKNPSWEHIVFDCSFNRDVKNKKRISKWENWEEVIS